MKTPNFSGLWWIALVALSVSGCASALDDDGSDDDDGDDSAGRCVRNTDCEPDYSCVDGTCVRNRDETPDAGDLDAAADDVPVGPDRASDRAAGPDIPEDPPMEPELECLRPSDCPDGEDCINNECVAAEPDLGAEAGDSDLPPDEPVVHSDPDLEPTDDLVEPDLGADECEGRDHGVLGDSCLGADDCCNGLCLGSEEAGFGLCTEVCTRYEDCNPMGVVAAEYFCLDAGPSGHLCAPSDYENTCDVAVDCLGQVCLQGLGTSGCSWSCDSGSDCPPGSGCGLIAFDDGAGGIAMMNACAPVGTSCFVDPDTRLNNCLSGVCAVDREVSAIGFCTVLCSMSDPEACPDGYSCRSVEGGGDAVCQP